MEKEVWKDVEELDNLYQISNMGRIKRKKDGKIMSIKNSKGWYLTSRFYINKKWITLRPHRLVAKYFIPNPNNFPVVNHKDLDKHNNCIDNLEWCTIKENIQHAIKNGKLENSFQKLKQYNKNKCFLKYGYIYQFDKNMNFINKFPSAKVASEITGVCSRNILQCINHEPKRKSAGSYIWLKESEVVKNEL